MTDLPLPSGWSPAASLESHFHPRPSKRKSVHKKEGGEGEGRKENEGGRGRRGGSGGRREMEEGGTAGHGEE